MTLNPHFSIQTGEKRWRKRNAPDLLIKDANSLKKTENGSVDTPIYAKGAYIPYHG